jgi:hypothetical protein
MTPVRRRRAPADNDPLPPLRETFYDRHAKPQVRHGAQQRLTAAE